MRALETNLLDWQKRYGTEEACARALTQQRWPEGFRCPRCGHDHGYVISTRHSCECSKCHYQTSVTAGTLFHSTNLPLTKWFWAIYLSASDKGGISAVHLSKQIVRFPGLRLAGYCARFALPWDTGIVSIGCTI